MWHHHLNVQSRSRGAEAIMEGGFNSSSSFSSTSSFGSSMGIIMPKSPPAGNLDLYGKRRQLVKVQLLEREIGLLQVELKSNDGVQAASGCCKELDDFVRAKPDPLIAPNEEATKSDHWWKQFQAKVCCNVPTTCCFGCGRCGGTPAISLCCCCCCCCPMKKSKCCSGFWCTGCVSNRCCLRLPSCCCGGESARSCCGESCSYSCCCSCL